MNNCVKDNKNRYLLTFLSFLSTKEVFEEVKLGFLIVDHTHEDIDRPLTAITPLAELLNC